MTDQSVIMGRSVSETATRVGKRPAQRLEKRTPSSRTRASRLSRAARQAKRRQAILDAALDEFSARGFAAARLDDVAARAGVAKGTIYLHFDDKEHLFQELVRAKMVPVVGTLEAAFRTDLPLRVVVERAVDIFVCEIYETPRM